MKQRVRSVGKWLSAALVGVVIVGLFELPVQRSALGRWFQETGFPALENLITDFLANPLAPLASPWAPWGGGALAGLVATPLLRYFLGRPRWPKEKIEDLRLASELEKRAEKREKAVAEYRASEQERNQIHSRWLSALGNSREKYASIVRYKEQANKNMSVLSLSTIAQTTGLFSNFSWEFVRRKIRIERGEFNLTPERMEAEARCWREIASALRKGSYKGKTFHVQA